MRPAFVVAVVVVIGASWLASCRGLPAGPSLSNVVIRNVALQSTTGNTALCCCRVTASAENHNRVPVHVTIKFSALDGVKTDPLATILYFVPDLEPGAARGVDAAGFIFPCNAIRDVRTEVDVKGIAFPPT